MVGLSLIVGIVCGLVGYDLHHRQKAMDKLALADDHHRTATATLMELHNKSVTEHAALVERLSSLEFKLTGSKTEPLLKRF